jgi:hypothetical protein
MRTPLECAQAKELFSDYREGSLNEVLRGDLEQHLAACEDCRRLLSALDEVLEVLRAEARLEPAADLAQRAADAALRSGPRRGWRGVVPPRWPLPIPLYAVAAVLALLTTGGVFLLRQAAEVGAPRGITAKAASAGAYLAERKDRLTEDLRTLRIVIATAFEGRVDRMNDRVDDYRKLLEKRRVSQPRKEPVDSPQSLSSENSNPNPTASVTSSEGHESQPLLATLVRRTL